MTIGIVGYGAFGKFIAKILTQYGGVLVYDKRPDLGELPSGVSKSGIEHVARCDIVIIASGLSDLEELCVQLAPHVSTETIVMDVCSVKVLPVEIMKKTLGGKCQLLATHPLFGPQTVDGNNVQNQKIVVYPIEIKNLKEIHSVLSGALMLQVIEMSPEEHDKQMAWVHALTFFVGRGLLNMDLPKSPLTTGYYQKLLDLVELERSHSIELYKTIEQGNPFAADVRLKFIESLKNLEEDIGVKTNG